MTVSVEHEVVEELKGTHSVSLSCEIQGLRAGGENKARGVGRGKLMEGLTALLQFLVFILIAVESQKRNFRGKLRGASFENPHLAAFKWQDWSQGDQVGDCGKNLVKSWWGDASGYGAEEMDL